VTSTVALWYREKEVGPWNGTAQHYSAMPLTMRLKSIRKAALLAINYTTAMSIFQS